MQMDTHMCAHIYVHAHTCTWAVSYPNSHPNEIVRITVPWCDVRPVAFSLLGSRISGQTLSYLWPPDTGGRVVEAQQTSECVDQRPRAGSTWVRPARAEPQAELPGCGIFGSEKAKR